MSGRRDCGKTKLGLYSHIYWSIALTSQPQRVFSSLLPNNGQQQRCVCVCLSVVAHPHRHRTGQLCIFMLCSGMLWHAAILKHFWATCQIPWKYDLISCFVSTLSEYQLHLFSVWSENIVFKLRFVHDLMQWNENLSFRNIKNVYWQCWW